MARTSELIAVARGDAPADLVLTNARVVNTFTSEIEEANVAIFGGRIAGIGDYRDARRIVDLHGSYLAPGLIDGHVHIESSYLHVPQYARAVVPRGTLGVATDLHEVANVKGLAGVRYIIECARKVPLDMFFMAPSCVPATDKETSGAHLGYQELRTALRWKGVLGVGEMMNFPGVVNADAEVMKKTSFAGKRPVDGHAPGLSGQQLNAYLAAGIGSDHETTRYEEGKEKLRRGMYLMIREGSSEKNLEELLPLVNDRTCRRCLLVVDDRTCKDILHEGDLDAVVRKAIVLGLDPVRAIQMATLNPAEYFGLPFLGGIAPGYYANLLVLDDLKAFQVRQVYYRGKLVAENGKPLFDPKAPARPEMGQTMHVRPYGKDALALRSTLTPFPVLEIVPGQIISRKRMETPKRRDGQVVADPERDLLKLAVIERHRATGNIGLGLVKGFGLKHGALASTVAHDSHNIVVVGASDDAMSAAAKEVERLGGGLAVAAGGKVLAALALPLFGLLSPEPLEKTAARLEELERLAREMGCPLPSPFATMSFVALPVIPELKLTDRGLFDVTAWEFVKI